MNCIETWEALKELAWASGAFGLVVGICAGTLIGAYLATYWFPVRR